MLRKLAPLILLFAFAARADHDDDRRGWGRDGRYHGNNSDDGWSPDQGDYEGDDDGQQAGPSVVDFESDPALAQYGRWIDTPAYGVVWQPTVVDQSWRPYYAGHWASTIGGWAWVSDEPFGWAVYHYGRWAFTSDAGWIWLPGSVWAPAWVAWRWDGGYAGWCPLGPRNTYYQQPQWVYVEQRHFLDPVVHYAVPVAQHPRPIAGPVMQGPRAGPAIASVERQTGRGIRPMPIVVSHSPQAVGTAGGQATFYRPRFSAVNTSQGYSMPSHGGPRAVQAGPRPAPVGQPRYQQPEAQAAPHPIYFGGVPSQGIIQRAAAQAGAPTPRAASPAPSAAPAPQAAPAPHSAPAPAPRPAARQQQQ
jgi:hypothetical protein